MSNFRVGQKVVCVDDANRKYEGFCVYPSKGLIYTVRQVHEDGDAVRLCEIKNPQLSFRSGVEECWFYSRRFRPVVERKTDISIFQAMLNTSPAIVEQ